jgi:hypothetical protein
MSQRRGNVRSRNFRKVGFVARKLTDSGNDGARSRV